MPNRTPSVLLIVLLVAVGTAAPISATTPSHDWPSWSGPRGDRTSVDNGAFDGDVFGVERSWLQALGSGYSGIVVAGDRAVTGFAAGDSDFLVALDTGSGREVWRYRIGKVYAGHDGSDDGPLATPTVHDGVVYGLGAWGELFALRLKDGEEIWARNVVDDMGAVKPEYGFTTAPAVVDGVLVVQTGGPDGHSVSGFDRATGELLWSTHDDAVSYQSPLGIELAGQWQVLAVTDQHLLGLAPKTGEVLWSHQLGEEPAEGIAHPVRVGEDAVLINDWGDASLYRIHKTEEGYAVEPAWTTRSFRSTYALPVYWQGHLYGYSGSILTCVDAETGKTAWKSRPPGRGTLILVDGHLVIQTADGEVVVAKASPEGYEEKSRSPALDRGYHTSPSFADGRIFTRNLTQIASLSVTDHATVAAAEAPSAPAEVMGDFGDWILEVQSAEDKKARIDAFLASQESFPILEGDRLVHFVYRGEVPDLVLTGNLLRAGDVPMQRVEGTDFYYRSLELEPEAIYAYGFNVFDEFQVDPLNAMTSGPEGNQQSLLTTQGFIQPEHLAEPTGESGEIVEHSWASEILDNERLVQIYLPPGYEGGTDDYPVLVVNHGNQALPMGLMSHSLDNLSGKSVEPLIVAFVPRAEWAEYAGSRPDDYARALAEELIPYLDETYRTRTDSDSRGIIGVGSAGFAAFYAAFAQPEVFGKAASQSFYLGERGEELMETIRASQTGDRTFYVEWSRRDYLDEESGLDAAAQSQALADLLAQKGHTAVKVETGNGPGWVGWRVGNDRILEALYPVN